MTYGGSPPDPFGQLPYGGPPIYSAPPQVPNTEVNTFATLSVVFAFLFAPAGAVLGHLGLAQIKRTGQRGRDRALIGLLLSYSVIVIAVVALVIWLALPTDVDAPSSASSSAQRMTTSTPPTTTTPTKAGPAPVAASQLPGFLLTLDDIRRVAHAPNDYSVTDIDAFSGSDGVTTTPSGCVDALFGGGADVYLPNGPVTTLARGLHLIEPMKTVAVAGLEERVTLYQNASAASRQVAQILEVSRRCAGQVTLKFNDGSRTVLYEIGPTTRATRDPSITMVSSTMDGSSKFLHVRVVAAKANVVVDMHVFGGDLGDSGESIAAEMLSRIPA